jgi:hypothetical protein
MLAAIGSFLKPFVPQITSAASSLLGHKLASSRQEDAQDFSAGQFATRYQTTVKDLEAAGLNPALAYQQGGGSPPSSTAAGASNFDMSSAQMALVKAQTRKINAEAEITEEVGMDKARADLDVALQQVGLTAAQSAKVKAETDNVVQTLNNLKSEDDRLKMAARLLNQQSQYYSQLTMTDAQRITLVEAQAKEVLARTGLLNYDLAAAKSAGNLGREFGQYGPMMKLILDVIRTAKR